MSPRYSTRAFADANAIERWRETLRRRDQQRDALARPGDPPPSRFWDTRAARFARVARQLDPQDPFLQFVAGFCAPRRTLLDVGAGTGRFALPLARRLARVVAVDPSAAMLEQLRRAAREEGVDNLETVVSPWESAPVEPADLLICAHVVYAIREIEPFVTRLAGYAREAAFIYMRVGQVDDTVAETWQAVYGEPRLPHPDHRMMGEVLQALGIDAHLERVPFINHVTYGSLAEAEDDLASRLGVRPDSADAGRLRQYLEGRLTPSGEGVGFPPRAVEGAIYWWRSPARERKPNREI